IFTTVTLGVFYFAAGVLAGSGYFTVPAQDSIFQTGDEIHFYSKDSIDSDESDFFTAELYKESGKKVRTISTFPGDLDDEHFIFSWKVDTTIKSGRYFAEMTSSDDDGDIIQSHVFEIVN
ncbi:hypothetical protein K501DRAFT_136011, partial [Backusella circina FSU 941]